MTVVLLVVVAVLGLLGRSRVKGVKLAPEMAKAELKETVDELKEEMKWGKQQPRQPGSSS